MAIQHVKKCKYIKCTDNTMCYDDDAKEKKSAIIQNALTQRRSKEASTKCNQNIVI